MTALFVVFAIAGACALAFALLAFISDFVIPAFDRKPWRPARRPAATYRRN